MYEIYHGERYWFDDKDEAILTQGNREFEQTPPAIQLFYRYFKVAGDDKEGEFLSPVEILDYLQKTISEGCFRKKGYLANIRRKGRCIGWLSCKEGVVKVTIES